MSYKFDSLIIILNKLDSGETVTVNSLINELEVSQRTVHRYIRTLRVAGFPINYIRAQDSYSFEDGYSLRRTNLATDEILAFALAKKMLHNLGTGIGQSLTSIESKLCVGETQLPRHIILKPEPPSFEMRSYLTDIHNAIMNFQKIKVTYDALHSNKESSRTIMPHYLFFSDDFWYLRGYCEDAEAFRTFALDRMKSLEVLNENFIPKNITPEEELSSSFGAWLDGKTQEIVLIFDEEVKSQVLRRKWQQNQQEKELKDGRLEIKFIVKGLGEIKKWIYQWIPHVEVKKPLALRRSFYSDLKMTLERNVTSDNQNKKQLITLTRI